MLCSVPAQIRDPIMMCRLQGWWPQDAAELAHVQNVGMHKMKPQAIASRRGRVVRAGMCAGPTLRVLHTARVDVTLNDGPSGSVLGWSLGC